MILFDTLSYKLQTKSDVFELSISKSNIDIVTKKTCIVRLICSLARIPLKADHFPEHNDGQFRKARMLA